VKHNLLQNGTNVSNKMFYNITEICHFASTQQLSEQSE